MTDEDNLQSGRQLTHLQESAVVFQEEQRGEVTLIGTAAYMSVTAEEDQVWATTAANELYYVSGFSTLTPGMDCFFM